MSKIVKNQNQLPEKRYTASFSMIVITWSKKSAVEKRKAEKFTSKTSVARLISEDVIGWFEPMAVPNGANDPVRRRGVVGHRGVEEMIIETMMMTAIYCLLAAKKKTVFGQMTLKATKALEYLKTTTEPITKEVTKFIWLHKIRADLEEWELPNWVMENEKYDWICILEVVDGLPFLVYQKSALRGIEAHLMKLEAEGATVKMDKKNMMTVDLGDDSVALSMWRNPNGGKFAPFNIDFPTKK